MERNLFKELLENFKKEESGEKKAELLLNYDLKTLTNSQIERLLSSMDESDIKKLINSINQIVNNEK